MTIYLFLFEILPDVAANDPVLLLVCASELLEVPPFKSNEI